MTFFSSQTAEEQNVGYTPSTAGQVNDQELARRLKLVQSAAPIFSQGEAIKLATQMAQQSDWDDETLRRNAQTTGGQILIDSYKQYLGSIEDPWKQLQAFKQFDSGQRRLLEKAGYIPPEARDPGPKGFGIVTHIVGESLGGVAKLLEVMPGGDPLKGLDYLAGLGTHAYRAARLGAEEGTLMYGREASEGGLRNPISMYRDFSNLWKETKEGEETFSLKAQERVGKVIIEDDRYDFVIALASGKNVSDYVTEDLQVDVNTPLFEQELQKYSQYQGQDDISEAVKDLRNNKYSPGRDMVSGLLGWAGVDRTEDKFSVYGLLSGGIDASFRIASDPTLIGGKVYKTARLSRYGINSRLLEGGAEAAEYAQRIDYLATVPRFRNAAEIVATQFRNGTESRIMDLLPQMRGGGLEDFATYLRTQGIASDAVTSQNVFDFYKSNLGTAALRGKKFAAPHFPGTILPTASKPEQLRTGLALGTKDWVAGFRLEDYGFDALTPDELHQLFGKRTLATGGLRPTTLLQAQQAVGNAIHSFYTKVPKKDYMAPDDDVSLSQFRAVLDYSLPGFLRDDFVDEFMRTSDYGTRRAIYESGVESMFHYSGALQTEGGKKLLRKVLGRGQVYAANGIDRLDGQPTGIGEADLAEHWAIPDFRDMLKVTAETTKYRKWLDGTNEGLINRFFANYWKPAVLLKAGFIPRAYGEEFLGFVMREGPSAWIKGQAAFTATRGGYTLPMRPVGWLADSLLSHIPLTYRNTTLDIYAHNFAAGASSYMKDWAGKLAPDRYMAAARNLAERGVGMQSLAEELGTSFGGVVQDAGIRQYNEVIGRQVDNGDIEYIPVRHGEITTHQKGSAFHAHTVLREMRRMQTDRLYAPLMDAGRRQFALEEAQSIAGQFADAGLVTADTSYEVTFRKIRQLVPNKVMPKFEAFLRNDSHASFGSVVDELVENGVDADTANLLVAQVKNMQPRQRVAIFTRDGELERIYQPHTLDPDAQWDIDSDLPFVRGEVEKQALREYHQNLEELWSQAPSTNAYHKIAYRRLNMGDMQETVRKSYRSRKTLDNRTVASPPAKGTRRVYTLLMDQDPVSAFEDLGQAQLVSSGRGLPTGAPQPQLLRQNPVLDAENGYVPFQSAEVNGLIPDYVPDTRSMVAPGGEQITPEEMAWFTQDFSHAQDLHNALSVKYKGQPVSIGYVDVPEDVFQQGRNAANANIAGGVDPLALQNRTNQVWIPKTWRENYQVLGEGNYQMIDGHAAVGATRDEALQDWALVLQQRYSQVFEAKDQLGMTNLVHDLVDGKVNVNTIVDYGQYLPDQAIGPAILEPGRENWFQNIVRNGFDIVGKGGNAMIRNQMFLHYYAQALEIETTRIARLLGDTGVADTLEEMAGRLGTSHYQLASDWRSLPDDIRGAANPYEAMIARDPIPPSLRQVVDVEDQKQFAEAWTAFYEHDNDDLLAAAEELWNTKYVRTRLVEDYSFQDLQNSYLSLDNDLRYSIMDNGLPPQVPKSFEAADLDADEWTALRDALEQNKHIYKTAHDLALKAGINDTVPWIDDHRVRSQFQQHGRNLIPFWFSQENFIKRVANNVWRDPASIRKAQVAMNAFHNSGFVTQNQYGEDVYNIPLTGTLVKAVTKGLEVIIPGDQKFTLPVVNPMTGLIKHTIPGLDTFDRIGPSLSPLGAIPLAAVSKLFPELGAINRALVGERGIKNEYGWDVMMRTLLPSYAHKVYEGFSKGFGADSEYASAMIQTAQMLEVAGHGLPENAEEYEQMDYRHRIENFTRMQMIIRGVVGFFSPAAPTTNPTEVFTPEFQDLLKKMPIEEAMLQFMTENPNARAYTIVKTDVPSKAPLSAGQEAGKVLDEHSEFFHKYAAAGPWLLPQSDDDTGFSNKTYNDQIAMELRQRKSLKEWYDDYYFASAAQDYFDTKEAHELRLAAAKGNPPLRQQLTDSYQTWKDGYLKEHKVFAKLLNDPTAAQRRQDVLDQMDAALSDPDAPTPPHKDALRDLVDTYKGYLDRKSQYKRSTTAEKQMREAMTDQFTLWVKGYVDKNPGVQAFYDRIIRPEMGID